MCVTWSDNSAENQLNSWQFDRGAEYDKWAGSCDWSPGAIYPDKGESWQAASTGAYDARWKQSIQTVETKWKNKSRGTLYIRFAHEMNGNWMPWSVNVNQIEQFKQSWIRFANIARAEFPEAKLVFNPNGNTVGQSYDWRKLWPGDQYVDVSTTDWYSNHWKAFKPDAVDQYGGPTGLAKHREFAQEHGKPFAVPEWGNNTDAGDQPDYIAFMHTFFKSNAGTGAGQVLYEGYFNVIWNPNQFGLFPDTLAPKARDKYIELF
jgi:beta-mannanase